MSVIDIATWVGLVLAVVGFPAVYNRLLKVHKKWRDYVTAHNGFTEPTFRLEWVDGPGSRLTATNMMPVPVYDLRFEWDSAQPAVRNLPPGEPIKPGRAVMIPAPPSLDPQLSLVFIYRRRGPIRAPRWWQVWWWTATEQYERTFVYFIREDSDAAFKARFAVGGMSLMWYPNTGGETYWDQMAQVFDAAYAEAAAAGT